MADLYEDSVSRAEGLLERGLMDEAWQACANVMGSSAEDGRALHIAGIVELRRGELERAIETLRKALGLRGTDPAVHNSLGETLRVAGDAAQAEAHFRYAIHLDIAFAAAHINLGIVLRDQGHASDAALCFRNALAIDPAHRHALSCLAQLCMDEGDSVSAANHLDALARLSPGDVAVRMALGEALWAAGRTVQALAVFRDVAAAQPENAVASFRIACAAFELQQTGDAMRNLDRAIAAGVVAGALPDFAAADGRLGDIRKSGDPAYSRVARAQWHKVGDSARVYSADPHQASPGPMLAFNDELFTVQLTDACVLPGELVPMSSDRVLFMDHLVGNSLQHAYTSRFIAHTADDGRLLLALPRAAVSAPGAAVLLGGAASHVDWLRECLARLWIVRQRAALDALPIVVQAGLGQWQKGLLSLLGYAAERLIEVPPDAVLHCPELHIASRAGFGEFVAPGAVEHLRRALRKAVPEPTRAGARIYLKRQGASARRLTNEPEIESLLRHRGFDVVDPEHLDISDLLSLMQSAQVIVGVEGAPMAHVFMAPPRATVGLIVAEGLQGKRYYAPSAVLGQNFNLLLATADFASHAVHAECDLRLDIAVLDRFLAALG
jgi:capsular polysaccharide biosynthesis protein/Flp pilus assembly protein TadD